MGIPRISDWNCIRNVFRVSPPSTLSDSIFRDHPEFIVSQISRMRYAIPSNTARARWARVVRALRPRKQARTEEFQYGEARPCNAGTNMTPPAESTEVARSQIGRAH